MQLQATQESEPVFSPIRPQDLEVISVTSSGSPDRERPFSKSRTHACSPMIVPETQLMRCFTMDCMVRSFFSVCILLTRISSRPQCLERRESWLGSVGSCIRVYNSFYFFFVLRTKKMSHNLPIKYVYCLPVYACFPTCVKLSSRVSSDPM